MRHLTKAPANTIRRAVLSRLDAVRRTARVGGQPLLPTSGLHITFKSFKFKIMNVLEMIPASEQAAELMRSLSHPQRLLTLCALGGVEKSVAELRQELGIDQVPMSQQLMRLRADGLVEARREGTTVYYRITRPEVVTVVEALHAAFCPPADANLGTDLPPPQEAGGISTR